MGDEPVRRGKSPNAFRTISEVADELGLPQHVLRFWESKFNQIAPMKRAGGRRYYRPDDISILARIRDLLHHEGYTIKGVQKLLRENGAKMFKESGPSPVPESNTAPAAASQPAPDNAAIMDSIRGIIAELEQAHGTLRNALKNA